MDPNLVQLIIAILTSVTAVITVVNRYYGRRINKNAQVAAKQATTAAAQATVAATTAQETKQTTTKAVADSHQAAVEVVESSQKTTRQASAETAQAVMFLAEHLADQLAESRQVIGHMATRNDDTLAALLRSLARLEAQDDRHQLPERIRAIEEFLADSESRHKQGAHE